MQEHIKKMAVEAGVSVLCGFDGPVNGDDVFACHITLGQIERVIQAVARECQQIADKNRHNMLVLAGNPVQSGAARDIAVEIRARFGLGGQG